MTFKQLMTGTVWTDRKIALQLWPHSTSSSQCLIRRPQKWTIIDFDGHWHVWYAKSPKQKTPACFLLQPLLPNITTHRSCNAYHQSISGRGDTEHQFLTAKSPMSLTYHLVAWPQWCWATTSSGLTLMSSTTIHGPRWLQTIDEL